MTFLNDRFVKRRRLANFALLVFLLIFFVWVEFNAFNLPFLKASQRNILILLVFQLNLILILLLIYFIFRYLFNVFLEIRIKKISKSLKFKLFATYLLSIIFPSLFLGLGSFLFLKRSSETIFRSFVLEKGGTAGELVLEKHFPQIFNAFLFLSGVSILLLIVFIGVWVGSKIARHLTEPLQKLILATQKISQKDYDIELFSGKEASEDELGILMASFKEMVEKIKAYEEEMKKYSEYLKSILNHLPISVVLIKEEKGEGKELEYYNQSFKKLLETCFFSTPEEFLDFIKKEVFEGEVERFSLETPVYKSVSVKRDGKECLLGITVVKTQLLKEGAFLLILENLEEKEKLKKLSMWKEATLRMAHEIKNPLTPINLSIQRLKRKLAPQLDEESKELLYKITGVIEKYVEELKNLATEFYYFSKIPGFSPAKGSLRDNIKEALSLYQVAYPEINFRLECPEDIVFEFDGFYLKRVWINLLDNAIKAMGEKGEILIRAFREDGKVVVEFQDSGTGLSEEIIENFNKGEIFKLKGIGTGLIMVYSIVRFHRGEIRVENVEEGGTKFVIKLPTKG